MIKEWAVWTCHDNAYMVECIASFSTKEEAARFVRNNDCDFWDEEEGLHGLALFPVFIPVRKEADG